MPANFRSDMPTPSRERGDKIAMCVYCFVLSFAFTIIIIGCAFFTSVIARLYDNIYERFATVELSDDYSNTDADADVLSGSENKAVTTILILWLYAMCSMSFSICGISKSELTNFIYFRVICKSLKYVGLDVTVECENFEWYMLADESKRLEFTKLLPYITCLTPERNLMSQTLSYNIVPCHWYALFCHRMIRFLCSSGSLATNAQPMTFVYNYTTNVESTEHWPMTLNIESTTNNSGLQRMSALHSLTYFNGFVFQSYSGENSSYHPFVLDLRELSKSLRERPTAGSTCTLDNEFEKRLKNMKENETPLYRLLSSSGEPHDATIKDKMCNLFRNLNTVDFNFLCLPRNEEPLTYAIGCSWIVK